MTLGEKLGQASAPGRNFCQDFNIIIIGSMDVNLLCPSCLLKETTEHIRDALNSGHTKFQGLDKRFLLRYLGMTMGKSGTPIDKYIPEPKGTTTLHSMVQRDTSQQFHEPEENYNVMSEAEENQAVGWVITQALGVTYKHHHYTVNGQVYRQTDGGPQGLNAAVEAAEIYMLKFDGRFLKILGELGIVVLLYQRYVDDISICLPAIKKG